MQISLGTGLAAGGRRRGRPPAPVPGAPALVRPPALIGTGRIGSSLAADPGDWTGAQRFDFAWLRDGAEVAGATGRVYVPNAADDRAALACRITAVGAAGRTVAETPAIAAAFAHPLPVGALPDLVLPQGTGPHIMDASPFFSGDALAFSVSGDGVAIDPATGVVTVSLEAMRAGAAIRVVAENSGGRAELGFTLTVTPAVAPILIAAPTLAGDGLVGAELAADPGVWAGEPAPELTLQWLCDGAPVAGATGARFTPGDAEDGAAVAVEVTARNAAGMLAARSAARGITRAAPVATGGLGDVVLALGGAARIVAAAGAFAGAALRFAVTGAGAAIDPATGAVTIPAGARRAAETVTVTATNSGGSATAAFAVSVLAAPVASGAPEAAAFVVGSEARVAVAGFFAGDALVFALDAGPAGTTVDAATGLVTVPTTAALTGAVVVRASNALGAATVAFTATVRLPAPVLTATAGDVAATIGEARTVDVGALVTPKTGLTWTSNRPNWGLSAAGVLTIPTTKVMTDAVANVTAADAFGQSVTATFRVTVAAAVPPMTLTAAPTLAAAAAPGTALGSVWTIAGGAYAGGVAPFTVERRFLRDGAPIAAYGAATTYTIVAADQGKTITAQVRRTDSAVPPQALVAEVAGSAVIPAAVPPMTLTAAPTLAAAAAPGTALGSVWTIAGGAYAGGVAPFTVERRFLRDGAPIAAYGAATTYAIVAADQGKTITAQVRRTDSAVPPQALTAEVAGSAVIPAAVPPMTLTAAPTLAAAAAPGTALGSVWTIAGGAYAGGVAPFTVERRFLRDGAPIAAYGAATTYTIVAADQGKTITAQVRRTDSAVPPQALVAEVAGSAVIPAAPTPGRTPDFTVGTTAQLLAAMITAAGQAGPKVIACNPGRYLGGVTRLNALVKVGRAADGTNLNNRVTIISADRRNPATFIDKGFEMSFADGFTFDGLTFQNTREDALGWPAGGENAFQMKDCANITVRNCTFSDWHDACNCTRGRNYTFEWNRWQRQGKDSCRFFDRNVNVLVQNNTFTTPRVDAARAQEGPRHPDFLSLQLATPTQRGNVDVTIRRNFFSGHNHYHQGIFMPNDEALTTGNFDLYKHVGVTITENWLIMAHVNTLLVAGAEDVLVNRNVVRTFGPGYGKPGIWDPGTKVQPKVTFGQVVKGVCRDNVGPWAVGITNLDAAASDLARINNIADPSETVTPPGMAAPYANGPYAYE